MRSLILLIFIGSVFGGCAPKKVAELRGCQEGTYDACEVDYVDVQPNRKIAFQTDRPKHFESKVFEVRLRDIKWPQSKSADPCEAKIAGELESFIDQRLSSASRIDLINIKRRWNFELNADVYVDGKRLNDEVLVNGYSLANGSFDTWCDLPLAKNSDGDQ